VLPESEASKRSGDRVITLDGSSHNISPDKQDSVGGEVAGSLGMQELGRGFHAGRMSDKAKEVRASSEDALLCEEISPAKSSKPDEAEVESIDKEEDSLEEDEIDGDGTSHGVFSQDEKSSVGPELDGESLEVPSLPCDDSHLSIVSPENTLCEVASEACDGDALLCEEISPAKSSKPDEAEVESTDKEEDSLEEDEIDGDGTSHGVFSQDEKSSIGPELDGESLEVPSLPCDGSHLSIVPPESTLCEVLSEAHDKAEGERKFIDEYV